MEAWREEREEMDEEDHAGDQERDAPERAEKQRRHSRTAGRARMIARLAPGLSQTRNV